MKTARRDPDRPFLAFTWMLGSAFAFSIMSVFVKRLSLTVPHMEIVFARAFVNFALVVAVMALRGESIFPRGKKLLIFRGLAGFVSLYCYFYSVGHLPLSIAQILAGCSPLFVIVFSQVMLGERLSRAALGWVGVAFTGVVLLVRPDFSLGKLTGLPLGAVGVGILGSAVGAMAYVAVRAATAQVGVNAIVLYFTAIATAISLPMAYATGYVPSGGELLELTAMGVFATIGQLAMTHGYRYAMAGLVSATGLAGAAFGTFFGWVLFGEVLTSMQWGGLALLAFGILLATTQRSRVQAASNCGI